MAMADPENVTFLVKQFDDKLPPQRPSQDFTSPYCDKVLCGNWQENLSEYVKNIYPLASEYMKEYGHPFIPVQNRSNYYNNKIKGWGTDWHTVNDQGFPEEYYNNFSTLYDLGYNRPCPQLVNKPWRKFHGAFLEYRPQQDMMRNFGNTVDYGLRKYKEQEWDSEKVVHIGDALSTAQESYVPPELPPILKRRSPYKAISSSFCKISTENPDLKTRSKNLWICHDIPPEIKLFGRRKAHKILPSL